MLSSTRTTITDDTFLKLDKTSNTCKTVEPHNPAIDQKLKEVRSLKEKNIPSLPCTLVEEKQVNPFLRCDHPDVIHSIEQHSQISINSTQEAFTLLRKWKDGFYRAISPKLKK